MSEPAARHIQRAVERWLAAFVVAENLCPFAGAVVRAQQIRLVVTDASSEQDLLTALRSELDRLQAQPDIATTLLIHPQVLEDFFAYNQFLNSADGLLEQLALTGVFQIASFHPHYQYAGTHAEQPENYANRSPYPLLHILRESDVTKAVTDHPAVDAIAPRNIAHLNALGSSVLASRWLACFEESAG